jgi:hypothetical protein
MNESGRCVFVANGQVQAEQVRAFLQASGITGMLRGESLSKTHGLTLDGLGRVEVVVGEADEEQARSLLSSAESGAFRLDDDVDTDTGAV